MPPDADFSSAMEPSQSRAADAQREALAGKVVVVLEDDELVRRATERMLRRFGAEVVSARSSSEALTMLSDRRLLPTAVIADYWLNSEESGLAAIGRLQAVAGGALRGVIITGDSSSETAAAVAEMGLQLLRKPVDVDSFVDILMRCD